MSTPERSSALTGLARLGFGDLAAAVDLLEELEQTLGLDRDTLTDAVAVAADPDGALGALARISRRDAAPVRALQRDARGWRSLWALLGASSGFGDFYLRHPEELAALVGAGEALPTSEDLLSGLLASVGAHGGFAATGDEQAWLALRVRYRTLLARIAAFDLQAESPIDELASVAGILADAAGAALEASLAVARTKISAGAGVGLFPHDQVSRTRLAIIGMGKTGARELTT